MTEEKPFEMTAILDFWFGPLEDEESFNEEKAAEWFASNAAFNAQIEEKFGALVEDALEGKLDSWNATPEGTLALILLLDQFTRNLFAGTAKAFAGDSKALALAHEGIKNGEDLLLKPLERSFFYMPFMHSEELQMQKVGVELYTSLMNQAEGDVQEPLRQNLVFMQKHRSIIAKFGRFPHRNEILDRLSTDEEVEFLKQPGSSF